MKEKRLENPFGDNTIQNKIIHNFVAHNFELFSSSRLCSCSFIILESNSAEEVFSVS